MPKLNELPRLRTHTRRGGKGQVWMTYWWDGRTFGMKDVPLGADRELALERWRACESKATEMGASKAWETNAALAVAAAREAVDLLRFVLSATDARPEPGVYFLLSGSGEISYVGQSDNVVLRMSGHGDKSFAAIRMVRISDPPERLAMERRLIRLLRPPLNIMLVGAEAA